jgi:hypothetical protein
MDRLVASLRAGTLLWQIGDDGSLPAVLGTIDPANSCLHDATTWSLGIAYDW